MDLKAIAKEITDEAERKPRRRQKQTENLLADIKNKTVFKCFDILSKCYEIRFI